MAQPGKAVEPGAEAGIFAQNLPPTAANHVPLSPLSFLRRAARVYPGHVAVVHHGRSITYTAFADRCRRLAGALLAAGVRPGQAVAVLAPNIPALLEAHYGVPLAGAVLCPINTLLDPEAIAFILDHAGCAALIADRDWLGRVGPALEKLGRPIRLVEIADEAAPDAPSLGGIAYEAFLATADPAPWRLPDDEWDAISVNYTSGTTGNPKGVVVHHRGAYLGALGNALAMNLQPSSVYLWTLPMFHCNGWTYTWAVTALGGTHVCLRKTEPGAIFAKIADHGVTHMCGAPIVLNMLVHAPAALRRPLPGRVLVETGGAAPPSAIIAGMEALGFAILHGYGLTESYGPSVICAFQPEWAGLDLPARVARMARQGVNTITIEDLTVLDANGEPVPADAATMGEIALRGNVVMKGYLKNPAATDAAFAHGWFHTGDLGVLHPDGYIEVKDRAKDIIISGGENISSLEVEEVLYRHPAIREAAVVARPDPTWGESPCAFVTLKDGAAAEEAEIIGWCRANLAHFKAPRSVVFRDLPKTATGKIQKNVLRDLAGRL